MSANYLARFGSAAAIVSLSLTTVSVPAWAEIQVVATMKPVHALVAMVMGETGSPRLIVDGATSPHTYVLKPSDAKALGNAAVIFRMSERVETFTAKLTKSLPKTAEVVTLIDAPGLALLPVRTSASFEKDKHAGHDHADDDHDQKPGVAPVMDGHAWLDPDNAKVMLDRIAAVLSTKDAGNAGAYAANAARAKAEIDTLSSEIAAALKPVAGKPYILFHDATQYFEARFGLSAVGVISTSPDIPPSGKRLAGLRKKIAALAAACVFSEPNFEAKVVASVVEGSVAKTGLIDPEGAMLPSGAGHYAASLRTLAAAHVACLGG
jgi:zinc transport system substrate-binding protein